MFSRAQCDIALELKAPAISVLWDHFGKDTSCLERFMPQVSVVQIHHSFHAKRAASALRHRTAIYRFAGRYPGVKFLVSLGLEDQYGETQAAKAAAGYRRRKPANVTLVRNSISCPRCRNRGIRYYEAHSDRSTDGFQIASNDGWGIRWSGEAQKPDESTVRQFLSAAAKSRGILYYFLWIPEAQGLFGRADRRIPASKRRPKITAGRVREINRAPRL